MAKVMKRHIHCADGVLHVGGRGYAFTQFHRIQVISVGKAAMPMTESLMALLKPEMNAHQALDGIVIAPAPGELRGFHFFVGGHPVPNGQSLLAGAAILEYLSAVAVAVWCSSS